MNHEIERWKKPPFDPDTKKEIERLETENPKELEDAFSTTLSFGTGGIRGLMGVGPGRLNLYTIRTATQGLAQYLKASFPSEQIKVFIGHDSRKNSRTFALETARVLAGNDIHAFVTPELRPTPFVSFGLRELGCHAGVMITASHNPKEYNGYKVYWKDGAQVVPPHDKGIVDAVRSIQIEDVHIASEKSDFITLCETELDTKYYDAIRPLSLHMNENKKNGHALTIVFTPLHGCGGTLAPAALNDWGFSTVIPVKEQIVPDGSFPTTTTPNPEDPTALQLGIETLKRENGDILLATDPDADRLACVVNHHGEIHALTGNQTAALILEHRLRMQKEADQLPQNGAAVSTIVSTRLLASICKKYEITYFDVLTGFKYIGEKIHEWEQSDQKFTFLFGAEESLGYLVGTHSRDKDAIASSCILAEIALQEKMKNRSLIDALHTIYEQYGVFYEMQHALSFPPSADSMEKMNATIDSLRKEGVQRLADFDVTQTTDYMIDDKTLPPSNVLAYTFSNNARLLVRPSGTEPKIKIYGQIHGEKKGSIAETETALQTTLQQMVAELAERLTR